MGVYDEIIDGGPTDGKGDDICMLFGSTRQYGLDYCIGNRPEGDNKWHLFANKQLFWWSAPKTVDNNNDVLTDF